MGPPLGTCSSLEPIFTKAISFLLGHVCLIAGGLLFGRTLALLLTVTLATSMAARQGPEPMAAHQICSQTWLAASLLSDSVALAAQVGAASGAGDPMTPGGRGTVSLSGCKVCRKRVPSFGVCFGT